MSESEGPLDRLKPVLAELEAYTVPAAPPPVKLDANESPWPLPDDARRAIGDAVAALPFHRYPDGRATALRAALARWLGAPPVELVIGAGSDEVIAMLMQAFATPSEGRAPTVLWPGPSFVMYRITGLTHGFVPVEVDLKPDFTLDPAAMKAALAEHRPSLAFYATPNNPTGNPFDEAVLRELIEAHPATLHILDEAYGPFHREPGAPAHTLAPWLAEYPNVGVLGTVSKVGLAALRVGWVRLRAELATEIEKVRQPFNLSATAQAAATVLLADHPEVISNAAQSIVRERTRLHAALAERGLDPRPSQANFILARVPASAKTPLLTRGVALRFFTDPRLDGWARITVGTPDETDALLRALDSL